MRPQTLKGSGWKAASFCPQCGGRVSMEAGDPVLVCGFCRTALHILPFIALRYMLPMQIKPSSGSHTFYVPYWRFKGIRYRVMHDKIDAFVMDATWLAIDDLHGVIDNTLGIKPQAMPLVLSMDASTLALPDVDIKTGFMHLENKMEKWLNGTPLFNRFVGESVCLIYIPFEIRTDSPGKTVIKNLCIPGKPISLDPDPGRNIKTRLARPSTGRPVRFLPLICPECGHDLPRSGGAVIVRCRFCGKAWEISGGRYENRSFHHIPAPRHLKEKTSYIPFWQITMTLDGFPARNRKEFKRLIISYQKIPDTWEQEPVTMIIPAVKLNPSLMLRVARGLTLFSGKRPEPLAPRRTGECQAESATISADEAAKAAKVIMADLFQKRKKLAGLIPETKISINGTRLTYLPFIRKGLDLAECYSGQALPAKALALGRNI
jgi:hypothetical protein